MPAGIADPSTVRVITVPAVAFVTAVPAPTEAVPPLTVMSYSVGTTGASLYVALITTALAGIVNLPSVTVTPPLITSHLSNTLPAGIADSSTVRVISVPAVALLAEAVPPVTVMSYSVGGVILPATIEYFALALVVTVTSVVLLVRYSAGITICITSSEATVGVPVTRTMRRSPLLSIFVTVRPAGIFVNQSVIFEGIDISNVSSLTSIANSFRLIEVPTVPFTVTSDTVAVTSFVISYSQVSHLLSLLLSSCASLGSINTTSQYSQIFQWLFSSVVQSVAMWMPLMVLLSV